MDISQQKPHEINDHLICSKLEWYLVTCKINNWPVTTRTDFGVKRSVSIKSNKQKYGSNK